MKKKLLNILLFGFIFHSLRDILQLFGFEFWLTNVFHQFGVKATNLVLDFLNISYSKWVDIIFLFVEFLIIGYIFKKRKIFKLRLIGNF